MTPKTMSDEELIAALRNFGRAYPEDMFPPLTKAERKELQDKYPGIQDRIAGAMGRHLALFSNDAADRLQTLTQLSGEVSDDMVAKLLKDLNDAAAWRRLPGNENHLATLALLERAIAALEAAQLPARPVVTPDDDVHELYLDALAEAESAMRKYPQPNYVISKVAEEAGEVVKAAIHCAENRETHTALVGEIKQAIAMLLRLYIEGDQVHGLTAPRAALASKESV